MNSDHVLGLGSGGFHRVHYTDWGNPDAERVVICVHGLTRNCRDFDALAHALAPDFRVICPDIVGRGESDWLDDKEQYGYPQYCADMAVLIARVIATPPVSGPLNWLKGVLAPGGGRPKRLYWIGTSMGGLIGMMIASQKQSPISKLVMNDVGMVVPRAALERIGSYVGKAPRFGSLEELEGYLRTISAPFGPLTDAQWRHLAEHGATRHEDGSWGLSYDPGIGHPFRRGVFGDVDLRKQFDGVTCPTLLLRGAQSDLLTRDTAVEMTRRGPRPQLVEFEGVGHAPMLMAENQIGVVREFLLKHEPS